MTRAVLDVVDPGLPALAAIFSPADLSALFGRPIRADRVRHKRGVSAVARLRSVPGDGVGGPGADAARIGAATGFDGATGRDDTPWAEPAPRWLAAYAPQHAPKLGRTLKRAATLGYDLETVDAGGHRLVSGAIGLDMKLHRVLQPFAVAGRVSFTPGSVLNYNPHRRVVFRLETAAGTVVCKAGDPGPGAASSEAAVLAGLAAGGVPVLERVTPADLPHAEGLRYYPWFGDGDLQQAASTGSDSDAVARYARAAGAALAALHARPVAPGHGSTEPPAGAHGLLRQAAERNRQLLPGSLDRLDAVETALAARLARRGRRVLSHGDFSADQVLVGRDGIRLADFDRATTAPAGRDVGSFLALDLLQPGSATVPLRDDLLAGYAAAGGDLTDEDLPAWVAAQLLDRLNEPFRACSPIWRAEMSGRLDLLERVLDGGVI